MFRRQDKNMLKSKKNILLFIFLIFINFQSFSHPHMWFTSSLEVIFAGKTLKGAYVTWTFDRFFSADIISGYDLNGDGVFNAAETADVYENAFSYTENYYYFTFIRQGEKRTSPEHIAKASFSVWQNKGIVSYRFFIDLSGFKGQEIFLACYDYTFFCDITYPKNAAVKFIYDKTLITPSYTVIENKNYPVYYDPLGAMDDNRIYYKWAPGLNTYYPKEVRIRF